MLYRVPAISRDSCPESKSVYAADQTDPESPPGAPADRDACGTQKRMIMGRIDDDPCYVQGYTAAIQDAIEVVEYIQKDLKIHKRKQNAKTYLAILRCMLKGRALLRESSTAFVRCNDRAPDGFEIWDSRYNNMSTERAVAVIAALCGDEKAMRRLKNARQSD